MPDTTGTPPATFTISYSVTPPAGVTAEQFARDIAEEQTVEIPHEHIPETHFTSGIAGVVESVTAEDDASYRIIIRYRADITAFSIPLFLNVLFGNISLKRGIRITDVKLPWIMMKSFGGPLEGMDGIREICGVYGRPLLATALKPLGLAASDLARIAGECARAGIDIIKDDHGIVDQHFHPFEERIARVSEAVTAANIQTGRRTLYFPNLCGPVGEIDDQARLAVQHGIKGVLLSPQLLGFDIMRHISRKYNLMIMAHPSFTGTQFTMNTHGIAPHVLLGRLFRFFGADISVFPSWGGRFWFSREECSRIASALTEPLPVHGSFPAPAGGMRIERFGEVAEVYGENAVLLVGGALLGRSEDLFSSTIDFLDAIRSRFNDILKEPRTDFTSSCELGTTKENRSTNDLLRCDLFNWSHRERVAYKIAETPDFLGVDRIELFGGSDTDTAFDLRYFEVAPGGYSSFEKHRHEHVIIGVRGRGVLIKPDLELVIKSNDIAYVKPFEPHQIRNNGDEPFGFYCIVDRKRDRPVAINRSLS